MRLCHQKICFQNEASYGKTATVLLKSRKIISRQPCIHKSSADDRGK